MVEKRMFTNKITSSDAFLDMPTSAQALYFHLNMSADDEGFVGNPKSIQRTVRASDDDFKVLLAKNFLISFESGVIVIKHWKMHNAIRQERIKQTPYLEEKSQLVVKPNMSYSLDKAQIDLTDKCPTNVGIVKDTNLIYSNDLSLIDLKEKELKDTKIYIIDYLNKKTNSNYRYTGSKINSLINARLKEGFKIEDFEHVIDVKCEQWLGTDMEKYLNYETLFGNKFEKYKNEKRLNSKKSVWEEIGKL